MDILGVDEAGRGSVLGPMVIAGVIVPEKMEKVLERMGVKDSKRLAPHRRTILSRKLKKMFDYCRDWNSGINGGQFTNYEAFRSGLIDGISLIRDFAANSRFEKTKSFSIAIPYKIGCARGGADWGEIEAILCDIEEKCNVEFIAYKMEE